MTVAMKGSKVSQSVPARLTVFREYAFEFNRDLDNYGRRQPNEPQPGTGLSWRHRSTRARADGYVYNPVVLRDLLMVAQTRNDLTTRGPLRD